MERMLGALPMHVCAIHISPKKIIICQPENIIINHNPIIINITLLKRRQKQNKKKKVKNLMSSL